MCCSPWSCKESDTNWMTELNWTECLVMVREVWIFPGSSAGKESACSWRDPGSIPGLGRSPRGWHRNPFSYSCWRIPMDQGAWQAVSMVLEIVGHNWATNHTQPYSWMKLLSFYFLKYKTHATIFVIDHSVISWSIKNKWVKILASLCVFLYVHICEFLYADYRLTFHVLISGTQRSVMNLHLKLKKF